MRASGSGSSRRSKPGKPLPQKSRGKHALIVTAAGPRRRRLALPAEVERLQRPPRRARRNFDQRAVERGASNSRNELGGYRLGCFDNDRGDHRL
jgi:hypothetical protein